ncbi:MAG: hypothetical protein ABI068_15795, partial [Ktedonobacterales bacterium]
TAKHPWLTVDHSFTQAGNLRMGEQVLRADGTTATVVAVRVVAGAAAMWDLTVSHVHTFTVGQDQFVVHNCGDGSGSQVASSSGSSGNNTIDLYRSVGVREYQSITSTGGFQPGGNSLEARQFVLSQDEALAFAARDVSKVAVFRATIQASALDAFDFSTTIDTSIFPQGVVTVQPGEQSEIFHLALISITQVL